MYLACAHRKAWEAMVELCRDENGQRFEELARWQGAVTLIWGEQDIAYRPERFLKEFQRVLPQAKTVLISGAGHYPHEVFPRQAADAIR
jgi:pimeloyl-ACP methyl ester carboxylesterase